MYPESGEDPPESFLLGQSAKALVEPPQEESSNTGKVRAGTL